MRGHARRRSFKSVYWSSVMSAAFTTVFMGLTGVPALLRTSHAYIEDVLTFAQRVMATASDHSL